MPGMAALAAAFPMSTRHWSTAATTLVLARAPEARKKQKGVEIKEIKLRPMIDDHDYDVKMRAMQRFFEEGDKVKITLRYRGREMAHQEIGTKLLDKVKADVAEFAKVEQDARFEGRQVVMVLAPR